VDRAPSRAITRLIHRYTALSSRDRAGVPQLSDRYALSELTIEIATGGPHGR
jgi:hypothetical protein